MHPTTPRIAIIGAGPGGLTCARVLQRSGVPVTVFARETSVAADPQGGTLELRMTTGRTALRAAGLDEEFTAIARPVRREVRLLDHTATVLLQDTPAPCGPDRTEVDRAGLRRLLLASLTAGTVHWGRYLRTLHPLGDGRHKAEFDDGHTETFDLVIGADGAWSRVRPMLSDYTPTTPVSPSSRPESRTPTAATRTWPDWSAAAACWPSPRARGCSPGGTAVATSSSTRHSGAPRTGRWRPVCG